jgi:hypothetical protein
MRVNGPRQAVGGSGSVVGLADENSVLDIMAGLVGFGAAFVPSDVQCLLRRVVQVGGEFAFPEINRGLLG